MFNQDEAKLYYLFMMADGEISDSELKVFDSICDKLGVGIGEKYDIIRKCNGINTFGRDMFDIIIRDGYSDKAAKYYGSLLRNKDELTRIIWNLLWIGYADRNYSYFERKIINYLVIEWRLEEKIISEFEDIAKTIVDLENHKKWISSKYYGYDEIERTRIVTNRIKYLFSSVENIIADLKE